VQCSNNAGLRNLIRDRVLHVDGRKEQHITLFGTTKGQGIHDLTADGLLVIRDDI
jgi:hypothetical protein